MRDLTINPWSPDKEKEDQTRHVGKSIKAGEVNLKLDSKIHLGMMSTIIDLEHVTGLSDLRLCTIVFLT